jgi:hypothetical protein
MGSSLRFEEEPLVIMKNTDVENIMWFISAAQTMHAQNDKLEMKVAELAKVQAKTVYQTAPSVSYK